MNILLEQFSVIFFFHQFTPLRQVEGLQCFAYDLYFIYKSDAFLRRVSVLGTAKWTDFLCINIRVICYTKCHIKIRTKLDFFCEFVLHLERSSSKTGNHPLPSWRHITVRATVQLCVTNCFVSLRLFHGHFHHIIKKLIHHSFSHHARVWPSCTFSPRFMAA